MPSDFTRIFPFRNTGMRRDPRARTFKSDFMEHVYNLKCSEIGHESPPTITSNGDLEVDWPWPQVLQGEYNVLIGGEDTIYDSSETPLTLYDTTGASTTTLSGSGTWQIADPEEDFWFLANGTDLVWRIPSNTSNRVYTGTGAGIRCVAKYHDQIIFGGAITPDSVSGLTELVDAWQDTTDKAVTFTGQNLDTNWLIFSNAKGNEREYPFIDLLAFLGYTPTTDKDLVKSALIQNIEDEKLALLPLPTSGTIESIRRIGESLMVYTTKEVFVLRPQGTSYSVTRVSDVAVAGRGAVAGDHFEQLYLGSNGTLYRVNSDAAVERLNYQEFLETISDNTAVLSLDPKERDYYISDGIYSYMWNRAGLSEQSVRPTALRISDEDLYGYFTQRTSDRNGETSSADQYTFTTGWFTLNHRGAKEIRFLELFGTQIEATRMKVRYRYDSSGTELTTGWIPGSPDSTFWAGISATELQFTFRGELSSATLSVLEALSIRFMYADNRDVRGPRPDES